MAETQTTKVVTGKVRLSYANIWEPTAAEADQPKKYNTIALIPKSDKATIDKVKKAVQAAIVVAKEKNTFNGKNPDKIKDFGWPLHDGDELEEDDKNYAVYKGHYYLSCKSSNKPGVVDKDLNPILEKDEIYSGCYVRLSLNFYPYKQGGVAVGLNNIQKIADGDALAGGSRAEDDFAEALEGADEDDDLL